MANLVIGFEQHGVRLYQAVVKYIHQTNQPKQLETINNIFQVIVGQVFAVIDANAQTTAINLQCVPDWRAINYTENPTPYQELGWFGDEIRVFGLFIYSRLLERGNLVENVHYHMETASTQFAVIRAYNNANYT